jgi:hypothetical protein
VRMQMSSAAIKHAQQFDWDRITEQWQELLELAVASHNASADRRDPRSA